VTPLRVIREVGLQSSCPDSTGSSSSHARRPSI
jgi:hypothetical protein